MEARPRMLVSELIRESSLTKRPNLIVEGQSDKRFYGAWIAGFADGSDFTITCIDNIDIPVADLDALGLNDGNRSRVICMASKVDESVHRQLFRCVADRDAGHGVEKFNFETLLWTDFPALESYALEPKVWDHANLIAFEEKLPNSKQLWPPLIHALSGLFAIREQVENLPAPNIGKGFTTKRPNIDHFDAGLTVEAGLLGRLDVRDYSLSDVDPRHHAYGHDIAKVIFEAHRSIFKVQLHFHDADAIENAMKAAMLYIREHEKHDLFRSIRDWIEELEG